MVSRDGAAVTDGLRAALRSSGLSQAAFARALGTSASRMSTYLSGATVPSASWYLRAVRLGEALGRARQGSWLTPLAAARAVREASTAGEPLWGLRMVLQCRDHLRAVLDADDQALEVAAAWEAAPEPAGMAKWDRLLAIVVGHEFDTRGLPAPTWTINSSTVAGEESWVFSSPFFTEAEVRAATPRWLAERGVFIAARDLVTA